MLEAGEVEHKIKRGTARVKRSVCICVSVCLATVKPGMERERE